VSEPGPGDLRGSRRCLEDPVAPGSHYRSGGIDYHGADREAAAAQRLPGQLQAGVLWSGEVSYAE
jgi:hypothetical protein